MLLDFCAVGSADQTLVVEIGKLYIAGAMAMPMASVSLKSITNSGTVANVNPFTGVAVAATTYRLFDLATITANDNTDAVFTLQNGTENDTPTQLKLAVDDSTYYYVVITTLPAGLTEVICVMTPSGLTRVTTKALP